MVRRATPVFAFSVFLLSHSMTVPPPPHYSLFPPAIFPDLIMASLFLTLQGKLTGNIANTGSNSLPFERESLKE